MAVSLLNYDAVIFDCDGVILDSNSLKTGVFRQVLEANGYPPDEVDAFSTHQQNNFGTSRYRLFETLLEGRFGPKREVTLERLLEDFSLGCKAGYVLQPETPGLIAALDRAAEVAALYVVSGSDEVELRDVLALRGLAPRFADVFGSPANKVENIARVRAHLHASGGPADPRLLFVGDAEADMNAALASDSDFVFMAAFSTVRKTLEPKVRAHGLPVIEDLRELL